MAFENIVGGRTVFFGTGQEHNFYRAAGTDDILIGGYGNDTLMGGGGNDLIIGGGFNDGAVQHFDLGGETAPAPAWPDPEDAEGADSLMGGAGDDTIIGGGWHDGLVNDNGVIELGEEVSSDFTAAMIGIHTPENVIWAGAGNDLAIGGNSADTVGGGDGDDRIHTLNGNDIAFGGAGDDTVSGGQGSDTLWGAGGMDQLDGGDGDDRIGGGAGFGNPREKHLDGFRTDVVQRMRDRGQGGNHQLAQAHVVEANERDVLRYP